MTHGRHIYSRASNMAKEKMCSYPQSDHELPHCKCLFQCCPKCPCLNIPDQETDDQYSYTTPSIRFFIYRLISICTVHGRIPFNDRKIFCMCKQDSASEKSTNIYTRKELVIMGTIISNFHTSFYIPEIHKLVFHLPNVQILVTNHCGGL